MKKETNKTVPIFGRMALARLCAALFFISAVLGAGSALPKKLTDALPFGQALQPLTAQADMPPGQASNQFNDMNQWWSLVLKEEGSGVKATLYAGNLNFVAEGSSLDIYEYHVASSQSNLTNTDIDCNNLDRPLDFFNAGQGARGLYSELIHASGISTNLFDDKHLQIVIDGDVTVGSISMASGEFDSVSIRMATNNNPVNKYTSSSNVSSLTCEYIYFDGIPLYLDQAKIACNGSSSRGTTLTSAGLEILGGELVISSNARDCINSQRDIRISGAEVKVTNTSGLNGVTGIVATYDPGTDDRASIFIGGNSNVTVTVQPGNQNMAIDAFKNVEISDTATVNATASTGTASNTNSVGICAGEDVIISGDAVTAEGDLAGIATGAPSGGSFGFFASDPRGGSITIRGGTTRATGVAYGIRAGSDVTIENAPEVTATGNTIAGIAAQDNLSIGGAGKTTANTDTGTGLTASGTVAINITGTGPSDYVEASYTSGGSGNMPVTAGGEVTPGDGVYEVNGYPVTDNIGNHAVSALSYNLNRGIFGESSAKFLNGRPVVYFDAQGGSVNPAKATANVNYQLFELPVPVRPGYSFLSWNLAANGSGVGVDINTSFPGPAQSHTIYAQWQPLASGVPASGGCPNGHASYTWQTVTEPDVHNDGEEICVCEGCGQVLYRVSLSAYGPFQKVTAEKIRNAAPGATVEITTSRWISFHRSVMEALAARPDVTLTISFLDGEYRGNRRIVTIPAGYDTLSLLNGTDYCGFLYLGSKFGLH